MKKIMAIALVSSASLGYAGNFFTVSGTSTSITVRSNVPNHTYSKVGIKMTTPGFTLSNVGSECTQISNGYCVFELSSNSPKTLTISGTGDTVGLNLCLNALGPVSCETFSYAAGGSGSPVLTDYVYVVNKGNNTISLCDADSTGALSNCQLSGAESSLNNPTSITFDPTGQYAYIANFSTRPYILACPVNPDKTLSSLTCVSSGSIGSLGASTSASQVSYTTISGINYVYLSSGNSSTGQSSVFRCAFQPSSHTAFDLCVTMNITSSSFPINTANFTGIYVNTDSSMMYLVDNSNSRLYNCPVTALISSDCSSPLSTQLNPEFLSPDVTGTPVFLPSFSSGIYQYPVVSGSVVSAGSGLSSASSNFSNPNQATPNTAGTYAFVTNRGSNTVSVCPINSDNTFGTCTTATPSFNNPFGIAVLSR